MKRLRVIFVLIVLAVSLTWLARTRNPAPVPVEQPDSIPLPVRIIEQEGLSILRDTPFDLEFTKAGGTPQKDLELVHEILTSARILVKDHHGIPLAENRDFTSFLSGKNNHRVAWIRPDHPRVNAEGELTDRWGTPLFFHQESSSETSLRSAGPDRKMWTEDDLTYADAAGETS
jgi:hypothetical protein